MATFFSACLVPPDDTVESVASNHAPVIDLDSVRPRETILRISNPLKEDGCPGFVITLLVEDPEGDRLRVRFVADNYVDNFVNLISDHEYSAALGPREIRETILPGVYINGIQNKPIHSLSMFVTDAPDFAVTSTDTDVINYGVIDSDPDNDGYNDYSVIEHRWTLNILSNTGGVCP